MADASPPPASTPARPPPVCAVLRAGDAALERALATQERPADDRGFGFRQLDTGADWLWILDGSAVPRPTALGRLLAAADRLDGVVRPIVLGSRVVSSEGRLARGHLPLAPQDQTAVAVRTATLRVLHVRAVGSGSLLVRREAVSGPLPVGVAATMAWTARLLADGGGFVAPDSVADVREARSPHTRAAVAVRLLAGRGLGPRERLRLAGELLERAGRA